MSILFYSAGDGGQRIHQALTSRLPADTQIELWPECNDKASVTTAIVWQPPHDFFDGLDNLQHILSISAGVDHLLDHPGLPDGVSITRLADGGMSEPMGEYVLYGVLHAQRGMAEFRRLQNAQQWNTQVSVHKAAQFNVGILGAGQLGLKVAQKLILNGYAVSCWSRTEKSLPGIVHFAGEQGLGEFLQPLHVLVCLLPLTKDTTGILDNALFSRLQDGTYLVNPGRGGHLVENDLLAALDSGRISGALLDVFATEPLPASHPFWLRPEIIITPHVAAPTQTDATASQIAESLQLLQQGQQPLGTVQRSRGY